MMVDTSASMQAALKLLSRKPRSIHEIIEGLQNKQHTEAAIAETVSRLIEWGYLNDSKFAEDWITGRLRNKPMGPLRLRKELEEKGISSTIIDSKLEERFDSQTEFEIAHQLAIFYLNKPSANWSKAAGFLERRGFSCETINAVLDSLKQDSY